MRFGVIGTANIGRVAVIPAIRRAGNAQVVAVASRRLDRAERFADEMGIPRAYGDYAELLKAQDIEAVYVPLPNNLHHPWTIKAAEAGKHILCEKPLALNASQCEEMGEAALKNGVRLMEAFMYRFHPQTEKTLSLVRGGAIGDPRLVYSMFSFPVPDPSNIRLQPDLGGGALMDVGCYCVNFSRTLAGREPFRARAVARWGETGVDIELAGMLEFDGGLRAQFSSALQMAHRELYHVSGPEGHLEAPIAFLPGTKEATIYEAHGPRSRIAHRIEGVDEYQLMVEHFVDCVQRGEPFRYPVRDAVDNMRAIEALLESARKDGEPVIL